MKNFKLLLTLLTVFLLSVTCDDEIQDDPQVADITGYNKVFHLVMKYFLDPGGLDKSLQDVLGVFYGVRDGDPFDTALRENFGISVNSFEDEFYDRMKAYLDAEFIHNQDSI